MAHDFTNKSILEISRYVVTHKNEFETASSFITNQDVIELQSKSTTLTNIFDRVQILPWFNDIFVVELPGARESDYNANFNLAFYSKTASLIKRVVSAGHEFTHATRQGEDALYLFAKDGTRLTKPVDFQTFRDVKLGIEAECFVLELTQSSIPNVSEGL